MQRLQSQIEQYYFNQQWMVSSVGLKARADSSEPDLKTVNTGCCQRVGCQTASFGVCGALHAEQQEAFSCHVLANRKLSDLNVTNGTFVPKFAFQVLPHFSKHTDQMARKKTNTKVLGNVPSVAPG